MNKQTISVQDVFEELSKDGQLARLLEEREALRKYLKQAVEYVTRKESHIGCMDAKTLEAAESVFRGTVASVSSGRWAGDMRYFEIMNARELLTKGETL